MVLYFVVDRYLSGHYIMKYQKINNHELKDLPVEWCLLLSVGRQTINARGNLTIGGSATNFKWQWHVNH